jgi:putative cell wall-binding protein
MATLAGATIFAGAGILAGGTASALTADGIDTATIAIPGTQPTIFAGVASQAASNETITLPNNFNSGDTIKYLVAPTSGFTFNGGFTAITGTTNCTAVGDSVGFSAVPTVAVVAATHTGTTDTTPTISASLSTNPLDPPACAGANDVLSLTLTDSSANTASAPNTDTWTVTISGIAYTIGAATPTGGTVAVAAEGENTTESSFTVYANGTGSYGTTGASAALNPTNATIAAKVNATVTANSPVVQINAGGAGTISSVVITEGAAAVLAGETWLCVVPTGWTFTASTGTGTAAPASTTGAGTVVTAAATTVAGSASINIAPSTTVATTYTISGLGVAAAPASVGVASAAIEAGTASGCGTGTKYVSLATVVFNVQPGTSQVIFGADADGTASTEFAAAYPGGNTNVVLATDANYPDALSASYLAGFLNTGILLTPTAVVSSETLAAICKAGASVVYVVGGPLAVSTADITTLEGTRVCAVNGGPLDAGSGPFLTVIVLFGSTEYDTAQIISEFPGASQPHSVNISGAYTGKYNDTTGLSTAAPASAPLKTAILATGTGFWDAASASVIAFNSQFPVLLTTPTSLSVQASSALTSLGIKQVILVGGPLAVSDTVEGQVAALGISVLRVAGTDYTDTSQLLAQFELNTNTTASTGTYLGLGWGAGVNSAGSTWAGQVFVARGDFFADALVGASVGHIGTHLIPLLEIENPSLIGTYVTTFLNTGGSAAGIDSLAAAGKIGTINVIGGPLAVTFPTVLAMQAAVAAG